MHPKLWSGKFLFTVIAAIVFAVLSINKTMPVDKVYEVILIVVYAYFSKVKKEQPKENKNEPKS